ncbi:MAG: class II fumarate hydratase [Planctomycetes bacterium]|nr:class II fumarate hydratase [Planctomycetota bacterium]
MASLHQGPREKPTSQTRIETDSMGEIRVPAGRYYGAQTQRAFENFPVSGLRFPRRFLYALGVIKQAAAKANLELQLLDPKLADAICRAAEEVIQGKWDADFVLDIFQTGSGTSTNMNANEVISNRAIEILGGAVGSKKPVHPNDHVNMSQSSNDVIPTAIHVAAATAIHEDLLPALRQLHRALDKKATQFKDVVKIGRTHLQDAVPITLGQEFSGYASQVAHGTLRVSRVLPELEELALGGTAVGTGINTHPEFSARAVAAIAAKTGLGFRQAPSFFEALAARDAAVSASGALKTVAVSLMKIANDLRLLGSGPRSGLGEIHLPELQPGSSIMPGKVNPVIPEMVCMVAAQVMGNDVTIGIGGQSGLLELNVMKPVIANALLQSIQILSRAAILLDEKCVRGLEANAGRCRDLIEGSLAMVTALAPKIGYDAAAKIAKDSSQTGRTVRELAGEKKLLPEAELEKILDPMSMTQPRLPE